MPSVEDVLTQLLLDDAEAVPPDPRLLATVTARSRRRAVRRRVALTTAAAATVAAVVVLPSVAADLGSDRPQRGQQASASAGFLTNTPISLPPFPLTPTYLPPGLRSQPMTTTGSLDWQAGNWHGPDGLSDRTHLFIEISAERGIWDGVPGVISSDQSVDGHAGRLITQAPTKDNPDGQETLEWLRQPDQWVSVSAGPGNSNLEVLLRVAKGLVDKPITPEWTFEVDRPPAKFALRHWSPFMFILGTADTSDSLAKQVRVEANRVEANTRSYGAPVTVGNRSGWLKANSGGAESPGTEALTLTLRVSVTTVLKFQTTGALWDVERLKAFAAGVTYSGPTPPKDVNS